MIWLLAPLLLLLAAAGLLIAARRPAPPRPAWRLFLEKGLPVGAATARPRWQAPLWRRLRLDPSPIALQGRLYFPPREDRPPSLQTTEARCSLSQPVISERGVHGMHLALHEPATGETATLLLLAPAIFARIEGGAPSGQRSCALDAPPVALETAGLRAEYRVLEMACGAESQDLLQALTLDLVVWRRRAGEGAAAG